MAAPLSRRRHRGRIYRQIRQTYDSLQPRQRTHGHAHPFSGRTTTRISARIGSTGGIVVGEGVSLHDKYGAILLPCPETHFTLDRHHRGHTNGPLNPREPLPLPLPLVSPSPAPSPSPSRLYTPAPPSNPAITLASTGGGLLGPRTGTPTTEFGLPYPLANDRSTDGRHPGGIHPRGSPTPPPNTGARVACFKCQGWGHFASQCPSPRPATRLARTLLVEIQDEDHPPPPALDDPVAEVYEADPALASTFEGTPGLLGCIIKELIPLTLEEHSLALTAPLGTTLSDETARSSTPPGPENTPPGTENPLRSAIFSTFTKIGTLVIKIVVDSGNVVNAVAAASVLSLGLQPLPHPRPYKAMWINDAYLAVTTRCIVPLQMAGYCEDVWCDILPMGVGSVLLGRPWLFDRDVVQYGRTNRCIFYFGGSKHVW